MIRLLVADDSAVTREYLAHLLGQEPGLGVVGTARNGLEAVEQAERLKPDVVLMDIHMPQMNGYEATRRIMERAPTRIVMISSSLSREEAAIAFEAVRAGALVVLEKPGGPDHPDQAETTRRLLETVKLMAEVKVVRRWPRPDRPAPPSPPALGAGRSLGIIAIGASTGGPAVVSEILGKLPRDLPTPILLVQHIAPGFVGGLAQWLAQTTGLAVKVAEPGEALRPATVYIAPSGSQMGVTRHGRISLTTEHLEDGFCPSASYLFQSVAESHGPSAIGIVLTGMGRDGAAGLKRLREAGAVTVAQDEVSSVVFGMPAEAIRLGAAEHVLSPPGMVEMIRHLIPPR